MNVDTLIGAGTDAKGQLKQGLGEATNDPALQQDGAFDQLSGQARKGVGALRDFAKDRPLTAAALAGTIGLALLGTLRGRPVAASRKDR